jgi:hypothetical protein
MNDCPTTEPGLSFYLLSNSKAACTLSSTVQAAFLPIKTSKNRIGINKRRPVRAQMGINIITVLKILEIFTEI